jgi:hypothetical protein
MAPLKWIRAGLFITGPEQRKPESGGISVLAIRTHAE